MKTQNNIWDRKEFMKKYTSIQKNMSKFESYSLDITVWLVNPVNDDRDLLGDVFAARISIPF